MSTDIAKSWQKGLWTPPWVPPQAMHSCIKKTEVWKVVYCLLWLHRAEISAGTLFWRFFFVLWSTVSCLLLRCSCVFVKEMCSPMFFVGLQKKAKCTEAISNSQTSLKTSSKYSSSLRFVPYTGHTYLHTIAWFLDNGHYSTIRNEYRLLQVMKMWA